MRHAVRGFRDRIPEFAWEGTVSSAVARHPWIIRAGGTLVRMLDRTRLASRTSLRAVDLFHRPEIQTSAAKPEDRAPTVGGGDGSPIHLPRNVAQVALVERCPARQKDRLLDRVPEFHGPRHRYGKDLLEVTAAGDSSRLNLERPWKEALGTERPWTEVPWTGVPWKEAARKIQAESPEDRMGRADCLKIQFVRTRREGTPGRR